MTSHPSRHTTSRSIHDTPTCLALSIELAMSVALLAMGVILVRIPRDDGYVIGHVVSNVVNIDVKDDPIEHPRLSITYCKPFNAAIRTGWMVCDVI